MPMAGNLLVQGLGKPSTDENRGQDNQGTLSLDKMVWVSWALAPAAVWTGTFYIWCTISSPSSWWFPMSFPLISCTACLSVVTLLFWCSRSSHGFLRKGTQTVNCLRPYMSKNVFIPTPSLIDGFSYRLEELVLRILEVLLHCSLPFSEFLWRT